MRPLRSRCYEVLQSRILHLVNRDDHLHPGSGDNHRVPSGKAVGHLGQLLAAGLNDLPELVKARRGPGENQCLIASRKNLVGEILVCIEPGEHTNPASGSVKEAPDLIAEVALWHHQIALPRERGGELCFLPVSLDLCPAEPVQDSL